MTCTLSQNVAQYLKEHGPDLQFDSVSETALLYARSLLQASSAVRLVVLLVEHLVGPADGRGWGALPGPPDQH